MARKELPGLNVELVEQGDGKWRAEVTDEGGFQVFQRYGYITEAAARAGVLRWVKKTGPNPSKVSRSGSAIGKLAADCQGRAAHARRTAEMHQSKALELLAEADRMSEAARVLLAAPEEDPDVRP